MARDFGALLRFLEERRAQPFAWGRDANDCVSFAFGAVEAMTGDGRWGRDRWASSIGAQRILKRVGGLEAFVDARFKPIAKARAMRGDIAAILHPEFEIALMVVEGEGLVGPGHSGVERVPRAAMIGAWSATEPLHG